MIVDETLAGLNFSMTDLDAKEPASAAQVDLAFKAAVCCRAYCSLQKAGKIPSQLSGVVRYVKRPDRASLQSLRTWTEFMVKNWAETDAPRVALAYAEEFHHPAFGYRRQESWGTQVMFLDHMTDMFEAPHAEKNVAYLATIFMSDFAVADELRAQSFVPDQVIDAALVRAESRYY